MESTIHKLHRVLFSSAALYVRREGPGIQGVSSQAFRNVKSVHFFTITLLSPTICLHITPKLHCQRGLYSPCTAVTIQ